MLYIISQNGLRITDLHAISIVEPEHDREDDGVYKVYVNGAEFARYKDGRYPEWIMKEIQKFVHMNYDKCFQLPKDGEDVWKVGT